MSDVMNPCDLEETKHAALLKAEELCKDIGNWQDRGSDCHLYSGNFKIYRDKQLNPTYVMLSLADIQLLNLHRSELSVSERYGLSEGYVAERDAKTKAFDEHWATNMVKKYAETVLCNKLLDSMNAKPRRPWWKFL